MILLDLPADSAFFRCHAPRWASQPLSGMGAATRGGRFNRAGLEGLYLSTDIDTALAEYRQDNPFLPPGTFCQYAVGGFRVADITRGFDPVHWSSLWSDHACDWRELLFNQHIQPPTWDMADLAREAGCEGVLFPSVARPGGVNLVVFESSLKPAEQLRVLDPSGALPRDQSSWA